MAACCPRSRSRAHRRGAPAATAAASCPPLMRQARAAARPSSRSSRSSSSGASCPTAAAVQHSGTAVVADHAPSQSSPVCSSLLETRAFAVEGQPQQLGEAGEVYGLTPPTLAEACITCVKATARCTGLCSRHMGRLRRAARSPVYSDRFIPSRAASSRLQGFSLLDRAEAAQDVVRRVA